MVNLADQIVNNFWTQVLPVNQLLPSVAKPICGDSLMEADWEEGFTCTRSPNHPMPHRDESVINTSTDENGRKYTWAYEWTYDG